MNRHLRHTAQRMGWVVVLLIVVSSCGLIPRTTSVIDQAVYDPIAYKCLTLVQPVFVTKSTDGELTLFPPGVTSLVPPTLELYLSHPKDWWQTEDYKRRFPSDGKPLVEKVLYYLEAGTQIVIDRIVRKDISPGPIIIYYAEIKSGPRKGLKVDLMPWFVEKGADGCVYPNPKYLRPVDG